MPRNICITRNPMKPWALPGDQISGRIWSVVYYVSCLLGQWDQFTQHTSAAHYCLTQYRLLCLQTNSRVRRSSPTIPSIVKLDTNIRITKCQTLISCGITVRIPVTCHQQMKYLMRSLRIFATNIFTTKRRAE